MLPILPIMLIIPAIIFILIAIGNEKRSRNIALVSTFINLLITFGILTAAFLSGTANISEAYAYIPSLGINFALNINIISLALLVMSSVVLFVAVLSANPEKKNPKATYALVSLFQISAIGLFTSSNLLLFFIFWDIGVIAMFFMINILGSANRKAASINFLIYEIFASSLLLLGIIILYAYTPVHSLDIQYITANASSIPANIQTAIFALLFGAFMINMPLFPAHFWLPDAHTEASTEGSMLLSGILTKFGAFGMLILFSMLPIAQKYSQYVAALAIISIFYSILLLIRQKDIKRIIAYSTIVEMGIIMVGIAASNAFGTYGAVYLMLSHGLVVALIFLLAGIIKHIFGERSISVLRGTVAKAKLTTYAFLFGVLAMVGFPLTTGFIADILLFTGSFQAFGIYGMLPLIGIILLGAYLYFIISKSMLSTREQSEIVGTIGIEQKIGYFIFIALISILGILPFIILNLVKL